MRAVRFSILLGPILLSPVVLSPGTAIAADFDSKTGTFTDQSRDRKIPYRIYYPDPLEGPYPVIIVSHGLGGSREGNEQLGKHLAGHGFVAVHIQHPGSDITLVERIKDPRMRRFKLSESLKDPVNARNRFLDVPFVLTQLQALNEGDKRFKGKLNLEALGMAGHSYGAISTLVAAGERINAQSESYRLPTLRAGLLLSPSPPRVGANMARVYQEVTIPLFHMTGTRDASMGEGRNVGPADRVIPYKTLKIPKQYLLVLDKAEHDTFSGHRIGTREEDPLDKKHLLSVLNGALPFFRAYLLNDANAEKWLQTEYKKQLESADIFEFK